MRVIKIYSKKLPADPYMYTNTLLLVAKLEK